MNPFVTEVKQAAGKALHQFINTPTAMTNQQALENSIRQAQEDWHCAESRFNQATDKDLIDHAIYDMMSARTRYDYLLKSAKESGL